MKILELTGQTSYIPFPNNEFQSRIVTCLSLRIDGKNRLWLLDYANHGFGGKPKLFGFTLDSIDGDGHKYDELAVEYTFPPEVAGKGSMLNDFVIDISANYIYIVDTSILGMNPGLIVYSVQHDEAYRLLSGHKSMFGESLFMNIMGNIISLGPFGLKVNIDSVALDRNGNNLYYGAVTSDAMYEISTAHLLSAVHRLQNYNRNVLTKAENEVFGSDVSLLDVKKPLSDGLSSDDEGNIWITGIEQGALFIARPTNRNHNNDNNNDNNNNNKTINNLETSETKTALEGKPVNSVYKFVRRSYEILKVIECRQLLRWPDGLSFGPDGLYITNSALHINFGRLGKLSDFAPFHILRIKKQDLRGIVGMHLPVAGQ